MIRLPPGLRRFSAKVAESFQLARSLVQACRDSAEFRRERVAAGLNVANAARDTGVRHLVYASVGSADRKSAHPHWKIKWQIEQHIRALDLPFTVLRPTMFMENHADSTWGVTGEHALVRAIPPNAKVQLIALSDIGAFAALAFANPEYYVQFAKALGMKTIVTFSSDANLALATKAGADHIINCVYYNIPFPDSLTVVGNAAGMWPALSLLAAFWLIGVIAMVPWYFRGVEGRGMRLEAMLH